MHHTNPQPTTPSDAATTGPTDEASTTLLVTSLATGAPASPAASARADYTRTWYALRYSPDAPAGLPPVIEADSLFTYTDDETTWVAALWQHSPTNPPRCILRVPETQVLEVTTHPNLQSAATVAFA